MGEGKRDCPICGGCGRIYRRWDGIEIPALAIDGSCLGLAERLRTIGFSRTRDCRCVDKPGKEKWKTAIPPD